MPDKKSKIKSILNYTPSYEIQEWAYEYFDEDSPTGFSDVYHTTAVDSDCEVEYEDGSRERLKVSKKILGTGKSDFARALEGTPEDCPQVVLTSINKTLTASEIENARLKHQDTAEMNPGVPVKLFLFKDKGKRQVGPLARGETISNLKVNTVKEGLKIYTAVAAALQDFHKNLKKVHMDFHGGNVLYGDDKAMIIDPGNAVALGQPLKTKLYGDDRFIAEKKKYWQIAPECWSKTPVLAQTSMDVYAFSTLMHSKMKHLITKDPKGRVLESLLESGMNENPSLRPSLKKLIANANHYLSNLSDQVGDTQVKTSSLAKEASLAPVFNSNFFSPATKDESAKETLPLTTISF